MNFTAPSAIRRAERELETVLEACADYQSLLCRLAIPDPVAGRVEDIFQKYNVPMTPRSKYGERPGSGI